ncbi:putative lipid II flippase MurJ [Lentibacillus sp. JNUCC-1]|uniref:murein biosynthesis integral membrane protein MurJ n=1 Tax=Lentibacillus sp. JNUCC-1 TaxID=2654513 RepID=UPI0012E7A3D3|nr:murein biosynthesis integral membrane protein MurJ [Lentibacillus sp. JNUCC-1]MUV37324.1 putative lipid II flippase MurJ [Lentibacillus sp. JNUCC-1]
MKSKLGLASVLFIGASLILKVSGLLRDMVIAFYFGDSYVADAYLAAFIIPNMFILFMTTGMKNAFVPSYIEALEQKRGAYHLGQVFKGTILISFVISVLGLALAPVYIPILYPEFHADAAKIAITVAMIFFGVIFFVGMNAVLEAFFDSENKFSLSVVSQIIVIMSSIIGAVLFADQIGVYALAIGYFIGAVISLIFKLILVIPRKKMKLKGKFDWIEIKHFYWIFIPVGLTVAVGQINLMVGTIFASYFEEGSVTYINYAKNLVHMPQGIFGVTIGTIVFPLLSKAIATDDRKLFKQGIERGFTLMYLILLPSVIGMMILMPNLIELIYQRGAFSDEAALATTQVAYLYFGSVLFFSLNNITNKGFYSLKKGHLILFISGLSIVLNVILNFILTAWMGYKGIPLAASIMAFCYVGAQFIVFYKLVNGLDLKYLVLEFTKITIATGIMALSLWPVLLFFSEMRSLVQIAIVAITGSVVYILAAYLLRSKSFFFLAKRFLKK